MAGPSLVLGKLGAQIKNNEKEKSTQALRSTRSKIR